MKNLMKAILAAILTEGVSIWMLFGSSYGPCGPGTILGMVGLVANLIPGIFLAAMAEEHLHVSKIVSASIVAASQALVWSAIYFLFFVIRQHRKNGS